MSSSFRIGVNTAEKMLSNPPPQFRHLNVVFAGNFLCFDYEEAGRPRVVVWLHEESREDHPVTEYVAANFDEFLTMLYECPE